MATRPNPDGWKGGSEDFTIVRTLDGHRSIVPGVDYPDEQILSAEFRRNERGWDDAQIGGEYRA